ncbi:hypothetical protein, partial [Escherichia coli]|uniref:hypothetical protein n=1 Tax=Escherichia coli TaxID=562 RepID=UPI001386A9DC
LGVGGDVDISQKTKVATAVFKVKSNATGTITFNVITASVNGIDASTQVGSLTIAVEPWQKYDTNGNNRIDDTELIAAIMDWLKDQLSDFDLIKVIIKWLES